MLEKKFQSDIMNNIFEWKGSLNSGTSKDSSAPGFSMDAFYRISAFNLGYGSNRVDLNDTVKYTNILNNAIAIEFPNVKIQNDMDRVIVIREVDPVRKPRKRISSQVEKNRHERFRSVWQVRKKRFESPCESDE